MTNQELFAEYGGKRVRYVKKISDSCWTIGDYVLFAGINNAGGHLIMMTYGAGAMKSYKNNDGFTVAPNVPDNAGLWWAHPDCFDWDDIEGEQSGNSICCRCGKTYKNKKEHNRTCK